MGARAKVRRISYPPGAGGSQRWGLAGWVVWEGVKKGVKKSVKKSVKKTVKKRKTA
jgi:hypothetical protein